MGTIWRNCALCLKTRLSLLHPGSRGPLRKLGQKLKRGSQIEPYRLSHSFNGLLFTILIHFRSNKARRKQFGGPFLVLVSNFLKILVWNPIALASGCSASSTSILPPTSFPSHFHFPFPPPHPDHPDPQVSCSSP